METVDFNVTEDMSLKVVFDSQEIGSIQYKGIEIIRLLDALFGDVEVNKVISGYLLDKKGIVIGKE
jgi:hypothetical protein